MANPQTIDFISSTTDRVSETLSSSRKTYCPFRVFFLELTNQQSSEWRNAAGTFDRIAVAEENRIAWPRRSGAPKKPWTRLQNWLRYDRERAV